MSFEVTIESRGFKDEKTAQDFAASFERTFEEVFDKIGVALNVRVVKSQEPEDV